jgi:hypothetical protein
MKGEEKIRVRAKKLTLVIEYLANHITEQAVMIAATVE